MKKIKTMALALIVAVTLTGAGYAAWSNTVTATTSMETGLWKVVLENDATYSYYAGNQVMKYTRNGSVVTETAALNTFNGNNAGTNYDTYTTDTNGDYVYTLAPTPTGANVNDQTACLFEFSNLHPGTKAMTRFEIRNKGSIPAKVEKVRVTLTDRAGNTVYNYAVGSTPASFGANVPNAIKEVINDMKVKPYMAIHRGSGADTLTILNGTSQVALTDLQNTLNTALAGKILKPQDRINTVNSDELEVGEDATAPVFTFELPASALKANNADLNSANLGMNASFKVKIDFDFVQYNDVTTHQNTAVTPVAGH